MQKSVIIRLAVHDRYISFNISPRSQLTRVDEPTQTEQNTVCPKSKARDTRTRNARQWMVCT